MIQTLFEKCIKAGGKIIIKRLKYGRYVRVCFDKKGKAHSGEIKKRKKNKSNEKIVKNAKATEEDLMRLQKIFHERYRN